MKLKIDTTWKIKTYTCDNWKVIRTNNMQFKKMFSSDIFGIFEIDTEQIYRLITRKQEGKEVFIEGNTIKFWRTYIELINF